MDFALRQLQRRRNDDDDDQDFTATILPVLFLFGIIVVCLVCLERDRASAWLQKCLLSFKPRRPFDVFVIHSGDQKGRALKLKKVVEDWTGLRCFVDKADIRFARNTAEEMRRALSTCRHVVVIVSYRFLTDKNKRHPREEYQYAYDRMQWLKMHYGAFAENMHIIFVDQINVEEYQDIAQNTFPPPFPPLETRVRLYESDWEKWCRHIRDNIQICDLRAGAVEEWMDFRRKVIRHTVGPNFPSPTGLYRRHEPDQDAEVSQDATDATDETLHDPADEGGLESMEMVSVNDEEIVHDEGKNVSVEAVGVVDEEIVHDEGKHVSVEAVGVVDAEFARMIV